MLTLNLNLLYTVVNILVLFLLLRKFLYKPVMNIIAQRQKQVDDALNAAETSKQEAAAALNDAQAKLRNVDAALPTSSRPKRTSSSCWLTPRSRPTPSWPRAKLPPRPSASTSCARPTPRPLHWPAPCARSCWFAT